MRFMVLAVLGVALASEVSAAIVLIDSSPRGAEVTIDGESKGKTPMGLKLEEGLHDLELSAKDYETYAERLNVGSASLKRVVEMKIKTYAVDVLFDDVSEIGWAVFDGKQLTMSQSKITKLPATLQLSKGKNKLILMKAGFSDVRVTVDVEEKESQTTTLSIKPKKGYSSYPRCRLAMVAGTWIYDDGRYMYNFRVDMGGLHYIKNSTNKWPMSYALQEIDDTIVVVIATRGLQREQRLISPTQMTGSNNLFRVAEK